MSEPSQTKAMAAILREHVFGASAFGPVREQAVQLVLDTISLEQDLLLYGKVDGKLPSTVRSSSLLPSDAARCTLT
jgi:hypothetical protein